MTSTSPSLFVSLPPELLHHIFTFLSPTDLSSLCRTSSIFHSYINSSDYLWSQIYSHYWDVPDSDHLDAIITQSCPQRKLLRRNKVEGREGKSKELPTETRLYLDSVYAYQTSQFKCKDQAKRRVWAERRLNNVHFRQIDLYANFNATLQAILSIARSRTPRKTSRDERTESRSSKYLLDLLTSTSTSDAFRKIVYPRTDARRLRDWQLKSISGKMNDTSKVLKTSARANEKRARSNSSNATPLQQKKRKSSDANSDRLQRRRSARLLLGAYPFELHHLLSDSQGNNLVDLDDDRGISGLEDLELLDEQLAAELHVLHGILPIKSSTVEEGALTTSTSSERGLSSAEDDDSDTDSDFVITGDEDELGWSQFDLTGHTTRRDNPAMEEHSRLRGRAREIVYDTARFGPENAFGPFMAYRERWAPLDGIRATGTRPETDLDAEAEEETEETEERSSDALARNDVDAELGEEEEEEADNAPEHNGIQMRYVTHPYVEEGLEEEEDDDFEVDRDDDDDEDDDMLFEGRELLIAASRGILPYYESERLKQAQSEHGINLVTSRVSSSNSNPAKVSLDEEAIEISEMLSNAKQLNKVWRIEKRIDWIVVEAIMVCMHANITHAVKDHHWGRHFTLPGNIKSLNGGDEEAARLNYATLGNKRWQNILGLPCGWSHSRGDSSRMPPSKEAKEAKDFVENESDMQKKPFDWAGVECSWIGTYSFLDWSRWAAFNARDPIARGLQEESIALDPSKPLLRGESNEPPSLRYEREAIGDCLQLQMELLPMEEQHPVTFQQRALEELEGQGSTRFPPLRFRGRTRTYDQEPPIPRGLVHGIVRPIFAPLAQGQEMLSCDERAIVGLDWSISHSYEGEDRWSLSGVQPGPPGSRSPIYGIWGSSRRTDALSPCGPFIYYRVA